MPFNATRTAESYSEIKVSVRSANVSAANRVTRENWMKLVTISRFVFEISHATCGVWRPCALAPTNCTRNTFRDIPVIIIQVSRTAVAVALHLLLQFVFKRHLHAAAVCHCFLPLWLLLVQYCSSFQQRAFGLSVVRLNRAPVFTVHTQSSIAQRILWSAKSDLDVSILLLRVLLPSR